MHVIFVELVTDLFPSPPFEPELVRIFFPLYLFLFLSHSIRNFRLTKQSWKLANLAVIVVAVTRNIYITEMKISITDS